MSATVAPRGIPLLLAVTVAALLVAPASGRAAPAGSLPPRPVEVVAAVDPPEGALAFEPAVVMVEAPPGSAAQPELLLVNGAGEVDVALAAAPVAPGPDGRPSPADGGGPPAAWITLPATEVHLRAGEAARLWPAVDVPADASGDGAVVALTATTTGGTALRALVVIATGAPRPVEADATLRAAGPASAAVELTMRSPGATVVEGRVAVVGWLGRVVAEASLPPTVLLAGVTRSEQVRLSAPALPGRYRAVVELTSAAGTTTAGGAGWLVHPLLLVAVALVLVAGALVIRRLRA